MRAGLRALALSALLAGGCESITDSWERSRLQREKNQLLTQRAAVAAELAKNATPPALLPESERNRLGSLDLHLRQVDSRIESINWELSQLD